VRNPNVKILIRIRTTDGKRSYKRPVFASNGKLKPLFALVDGKPKYHPEGVYCLRYSKSGKRIWEEVGKDAGKAITEKLKREGIIRAQTLGIEVVEASKDSRKPKLRDAICEYLGRVEISRSRKTYGEFARMLPDFVDVCRSQYAHEVTSYEIMRYAHVLRQRGLAKRTVANRVARVTCFLKWAGVADLLNDADKQSLKYVRKTVDAYSTEQLLALFSAATEKEWMILQFFLGSGGREAEVANATWFDISFSDHTFVVHDKPERGFRPKDNAERRIPLSDELIEALRTWRELHPSDVYIFPNELGRPNGHFLRMLKQIAFRAGLDCGECFGVEQGKRQTCRTSPTCAHFTLHKFRRTFATFHHEHGVPVTQIQDWLGHESIETTLLYLAISDARSEKSRRWANGTFKDLFKTRLSPTPTTLSSEPFPKSHFTTHVSIRPPEDTYEYSGGSTGTSHRLSHSESISCPVGEAPANDLQVDSTRQAAAHPIGGSDRV
jgi:integrase/recombinase XerD